MQALDIPPANLVSPEQTAAFACTLAPLLEAGDTLLLAGEIGAGKTHFCRALIQARLQAAGLMEDVPSPTYTLVQTYSDRKAEIWHVDLYRISDPAEIEELGLMNAFDEAICLVEWPERLGPLIPPDALRLDMKQGDGPQTRIVSFASRNRGWKSRIMRALRECRHG